MKMLFSEAGIAAALFGYIDKNVDTNNWKANYFVNNPTEIWLLIKKYI